MARSAAVSIEDQVRLDFATIWAGYSHDRLENPARQKELVRSAHKYAVCLSLFSKAISSRDESKRVFLQEASSDAIHLVHALMTGDGRGGCFYLRSILENFWRHSYFEQHPVEYGWLHTRKKYHLAIKDLREHCSHLDQYQGRLKISLQTLDRLYAELSTRVHSSSSRTLVLREALEQIQLSSIQTPTLAKDLRDVFKDVIVLIAFSSRDVFDGLHVNAQAFILSCLDSQRKIRRQADLLI